MVLYISSYISQQHHQEKRANNTFIVQQENSSRHTSNGIKRNTESNYVRKQSLHVWLLNAKVAAFSSLLADIPAPASQPSFCCTAQRSSCCARTRTSHLATAMAPRSCNFGTSPLVALAVVSIVLVLQSGRKRTKVLRRMSKSFIITNPHLGIVREWSMLGCRFGKHTSQTTLCHSLSQWRRAHLMCRVTQWFCSEEFLAQHNIQYEGRQGSVPVFAGSQPSAKLCRGLRGKRKLNHEDCDPCRSPWWSILNAWFAERRIAGSQPSAVEVEVDVVQVQEEGWMKMQVQERRGVSSWVSPVEDVEEWVHESAQMRTSRSEFMIKNTHRAHIKNIKSIGSQPRTCATTVRSNNSKKKTDK